MFNSLGKYCFQILRVYFGFFGDKKVSAILKERSEAKFKLVAVRSYDRRVRGWM